MKNKKKCSTGGTISNVPQMSLGGWVRDNKEGVLGGLATAGGVASMFIPGMQGLSAPLLSAGLGAITNEIQDDNITGQTGIGVGSRNNYLPTFAKGGSTRSVEVELEKDEVFRTPSGSIAGIKGNAELSHANSGAQMSLEEGTQVLGKNIDKETGKMYKELGAELAAKYKKLIDLEQTSKNKFTQNAIKVMKQRLQNKFTELFEKQEREKPTEKVDKKKMAAGGPVGPDGLTDEERTRIDKFFSEYMQEPYNDYPTLDSATNANIDNFFEFENNFRGYPTNFSGFPTTNPLSSLSNKQNPIQTITPTTPKQNFGFANKLKTLGGAYAKAFNPFSYIPQQQAATATTKSTIAPATTPVVVPNNKIDLSSAAAQGAMSPTVWKNNVAPGIDEEPLVAETWMNKPFSGNKGPARIRVIDNGDPADHTPVISNEKKVVQVNNIGSAKFTPTDDFRKSAGNAGSKFGLNEGLMLAPMAYNFIRGLQKPEKETLPAQYNRGLSALANRRANIDPILDANRSAQSIYDYNLRQSGAGAGQLASGRLASMSQRMLADQGAYSQKNNIDNEYLGQYAQGLFGVGAAQANVNAANLQNIAARNNMLGAAMTNLSDFGAVRSYQNNLMNRESQMYDLYSKWFPYMSKWAGTKQDWDLE